MLGLTLVELMMTVSIIGIVAAMAIPSMASLHGGEVSETRHRRNAQEIAAVFVTAQAAGLDFASSGSLEQTIRSVITGGSPTEGPFRGKLYVVRGLLDEDVVAVQRYLSLENGVLCYHSHGL